MSRKDERIRELEAEVARQHRLLVATAEAARTTGGLLWLPQHVDQMHRTIEDLRRRADEAEKQYRAVAGVPLVAAYCQARDLLSETAAAAGYTATALEDLPAFVALIRQERADARGAHARSCEQAGALEADLDTAARNAERRDGRMRELIGQLDAATLRLEQMQTGRLAGAPAELVGIAEDVETLRPYTAGVLRLIADDLGMALLADSYQEHLDSGCQVNEGVNG